MTYNVYHISGDFSKGWLYKHVCCVPCASVSTHCRAVEKCKHIQMNGQQVTGYTHTHTQA